MLKILRQGEKFSQPCVLLLGGFDGIHVGHQKLIEVAKKYALPVGLTSISGGKKGGDLFTATEREYIYSQLGLNFTYELIFTPQFQNTTKEEFLAELQRNFPLSAVVCGSDFRFGRGAEGDAEFLRSALPCPVEVVKLRKIGGEKVASTQIKRLLSEGNLSAVNELLAYPYFLQGRVEEGRKVGRTLGFPTLNLTFPEEKFPLREGVYGGYAMTKAGRFPAIVHFGSRPTFGVTERKVEAYLDGFSGNLYGEEAQIFPTEYIRPVQAFSSREQLIAQLNEDVGRLRND